MSPTQRTLTLITQVYPPDPAAVGQHFADAMERMVHEGWKVTVFTANRGYDDPSRRYPNREIRGGVIVRRLPLSSFGKSSFLVRLLAQGLFSLQALVLLVLGRCPDLLVVGSSPPFAGFLGVVVNRLRAVPFVWWPMDINPDQMVSSGRIRAGSVPERLFDWMNRLTLSRAAETVVLDEKMRERVAAKVNSPLSLSVIPPWSHDQVLDQVPHEANPFRMQHSLQGKVVVMYSGNHGLSTPLDTLLAAAAKLTHNQRLVFVFIGGGVIKKAIDQLVERQRPANIISLPYQPLDRIRFSLSAADAHVVSIANEAVGIIHPCKLYGALSIGCPIISLGPSDCHASRLVQRERLGWICEHGDVDGLCRILETLDAQSAADRDSIGARGRALSRGPLSRDAQLARIAGIFKKVANAVA